MILIVPEDLHLVLRGTREEVAAEYLPGSSEGFIGDVCLLW